MVKEQDYYVPDGCVDLPYLHVFDATSLTDGTSPRTLDVRIGRNEDFSLRAILGAPYVVNPATGGIILYNYSGSRAYSSAIIPCANNMPVSPEKIYPRNSSIRFDLVNILRKNIACATTIFFPQLVFQGIKRYRPSDPNYQVGAPQIAPPFDPAQYILRPWTYTVRFSLSWFKWIAPAASGIIDVPRTFVQPVQDYDFELHYINVGNVTTGARLTADLFQMTLYDSTAKRPLSELPVNQSYWNNNRSEFGNPVFPVPPLVYPVWSQIKFDIWSLVCNTDPSSPYSIEINFVGVQRIPKMAPDSGGVSSSTLVGA